jgi:hypothetical protein
VGAKNTIIIAVVGILVAANVYQFDAWRTKRAEARAEAIELETRAEKERLTGIGMNIAHQVTQAVLNSRIAQLDVSLQEALKKAKTAVPSLKPSQVEDGDSGAIKPVAPGTGTPSEKCLFAEGESGRIQYQRVQAESDLKNSIVLVHAKALNNSRGDSMLFEADLKVNLDEVAPTPVIDTPRSSYGFTGGFGIGVGFLYGVSGSREMMSFTLPLIGKLRVDAGLSALTGPQMPLMVLGNIGLGR